jgi:hypothetical protein
VLKRRQYDKADHRTLSDVVIIAMKKTPQQMSTIAQRVAHSHSASFVSTLSWAAIAPDVKLIGSDRTNGPDAQDDGAYDREDERAYDNSERGR